MADLHKSAVTVDPVCLGPPADDERGVILETSVMAESRGGSNKGGIVQQHMKFGRSSCLDVYSVSLASVQQVTYNRSIEL